MSIKRALALLLLALGIALLALPGLNRPTLYQYVLPAPKASAPEAAPAPAQEKENSAEEAPQPKAESELMTQLKSLTRALEDKEQDGFAVSAYTPSVPLAVSQANSQQAQVVGLWGDTFVLPTPVVRFGRLLYADELETGEKVAVLEEQAAIALFRVSDPVGRSFDLSGTTYRVVGVVRHTRTPGEQAPFSVYVPLKALDRQGFQSQVLVVGIKPVLGAGAQASLGRELEKWQPSGQLISLPKEGERALLPLRYLLCALGVMVLAISLRFSARFSKNALAYYRNKLETQYANRLLPLLLGIVLLIILIYTAQIALSFLLFLQITQPVYTFPEWVPTVVVEWQEISKTFWQNVSQNTRLVSLRTPESLTLSFYGRALGACCLLFFLLILKPYHLFRERLFPKD